MARKSVGGLVKRGDCYYYRRCINGKVTQIILLGESGERITDKEKANKALTVYQQEQIELSQLKSKEALLFKVGEAKGLLTRCKILIAEVDKAFFTNPQRQEFSQSSARMYGIFLQRFQAFIKEYHPEVIFLSDVTPKIAKTFIDYYRKTGISNRTYNYCLLCLSIVFRLYFKEDEPFKDIPKRKLETEERLSFTVEQLASIWQTLQSDYHILYKSEMVTLYILALNTGLRCGDCCLLDWKNINLDQRIIEIIPSKTKQSSRKKVLLPINDTLLDHLIRLTCNRQGLLMPHVAQRYKSNPTGIYADTVKLLEASGITTKTEPETTRKTKVVRYSFHSFRHTFASLLIDSGASQTVVSRLLGHSTLTMTNRYVHVSDGKRLEAVNNLPCVTQGNKIKSNVIADKKEILLSYLTTVLTPSQMDFVKTLTQ